ncbi:hypothetical protein N7520_002339 [Penicillium odoratum]|uniref:uncharacterized protein n=1 Tax=Penicillium odoratum TaxID=1167516 RepID=UPI00254760D6|nr:uncharacterized protein N7520_002339 [Penicillium odoratum]KAJ5771810.1 hypothetical protein N7520_002339 [Penicillium odoratum]
MITLTSLAAEAAHLQGLTADNTFSDALWEALSLEDSLEREREKQRDLERQIVNHPTASNLPRLIIRRNAVAEVLSAIRVQTFAAFCSLSKKEQRLFWHFHAERNCRLVQRRAL